MNSDKSSISEARNSEEDFDYFKAWKEFGRLSHLVQSGKFEALKDVLSKRRRTRRSKQLNEALLIAAEYGMKDAMELLLEHGASPTCISADYTKMNPFLYVLERCDEDIDLVRLLLKYCENKLQVQEMIEHKHWRNYSGLEYAVINDQTEAVKELVKFGIDVNQGLFSKRRSALIVAIDNKNCEMVDILIETDCDVDQECMRYKTPLMYAVRAGCEHCIKKLLLRGANVDKADQEGRTPLMFAASRGNCLAIELLLKHGANINAIDSRSLTPFFCAMLGHMNQNGAILLLDNGADPYVGDHTLNPLLLAVKKNQADVVDKLLEKGCDINYLELGGNNVISTAIMCGSEEVFDYLMQYFDPWSTKKHPVKLTFDLNTLWSSRNIGYRVFTPLTTAVWIKNCHFVNNLLDYGAEINQRDAELCTPLTMAVSRCIVHKSSDVIIDLLRYGADPNLKGNSFNGVHIGKSREFYGLPLEIAITFMQPGFVHMLWVAGSSLGCWDLALDTIPWRYKVGSRMEIENLYTYLKEKERNPRSLTDISRIKIRQCLSNIWNCSIEKKIYPLPLPVVLQDYLDLPELDDIVEEYTEKVMGL